MNEKYSINNLEIFNALLEFFKKIDSGELGYDAKKHYLINSEQQKILHSIQSADGSFIKTILQDKNTYEQLISIGGAELLKNVLELTIKHENSIELLDKLKELDIDTLKELHTLAGISQLKSVQKLWLDNINNSNEEFWQNTFNENSWIISQIFSFPLIILNQKAFVGGKNIGNKSGNIIDFIFQNSLTENAVLVEIKTPSTRLLGSGYRSTYAVSQDLSGSVIQLSKYKATLSREYANLIINNKGLFSFEMFNPCCLLIIGNFREEIGEDYDKKEAFELFRSNSHHTDIITFDELFKKLEILIGLLEGERI